MITKNVTRTLLIGATLMTTLHATYAQHTKPTPENHPRIELAEPVTVTLAPPKVRGWGPYQFPSLARLPDGRALLDGA